MIGNFDKKDKNESRNIIIALVSLAIILAIAAILLLPALSEIMNIHFSPGVGFKDSAIISFFVTIILMVVLTVTAGDGLIGELQFILSGFLLFFVIIWLMIAWIF